MASKKTAGLYVRNTNQETLCIPGFPAFAPGEVRLVSAEEYNLLLSNPHIVADAGDSDEPVPSDK